MIRNDIMMTSLPKGHNSNLGETNHIIYHSKNFDKSHLEMYLLLNLNHCVKSYGHLCQILTTQ